MTRQIVFILEKQDAIEALKAYYRDHALSRQTFIRLLLLWIVAVALMSAVLVMIDGADWYQNWGHSLYRISAIYAAIIIAIWALNYFVLIPHHVQQLVKHDKQIGLEQTLVWDDHAVAIKSSYIRGTYPFRLFSGWREYPTFIALYISPKKFNVLPKAPINDEQLEDLRTIFKREIAAEEK